MKENKIISTTFKFVTVRNAQKSTREKQNLRFITFDPSLNTVLFQSLEQMAVSFDANNYVELSKRCESLSKIKSVNEIETLVGDLIIYGEKLLSGDVKSLDRDTSIDIVRHRNTTIPIVWDNLICQAIVGGYGEVREGLITALRAWNYLNITDVTPNLKEHDLRSLSKATVLFPEWMSNLVPAKQIVNPQRPEEDQAAKAKKTKAIETLGQIKKTSEELQNAFDAMIESSKFISINDNSTDPASRTIEPDYTFSASTKTFLGTFGIDTTNFKIPYILSRLEKESFKLQREIWGDVEMKRTIYKFGGGLWAEDTLEALPHDHFTIEDPRKDDPYLGFYPNDGKCRIKPLGVADLRRVEQEFCCMKPGEVAHIENIMQGEWKERSTRRLKRTEDTFTTTSEREEINERDTIATDRYEMERETSKEIERQMAFDLGVTASYFGPVNVVVDSNFSTSTASQESDTLAVAYAKEITERSLQRIIERVKEERITKVIEEYEENNKHGLDNRGGNKHVVGLYRWADKIYKAQVKNYGKRLMFEFMIVEPAAFHLWAMMKSAAQTGVAINEPIDPRSDAAATLLGLPGSSLKSHTQLDASNYSLWAAAYGATIEAMPAALKRIGVAIEDTIDADGALANDSARISTGVNQDLVVPDGYEAFRAYVTAQFHNDALGGRIPNVFVYLANTTFYFAGASGTTLSTIGATLPNTQVTSNLYHTEGVIPCSYRVGFSDYFICNIEVDCRLRPDALEAWQIKTFRAIIEAYERQKAAYDISLSEAKVRRGVDIQGTNPSMNRQIEQQELKKSCISSMFQSQDFGSSALWYYSPENDWISRSDNNDCNTPVTNYNCSTIRANARAKFLEQAFEWKLMTYQFYPYFYGNKCRWRKLYQLNDADPMFLNFLQAGIAKVIVSVKPGYEQAAMEFLRDPNNPIIWNGGSLAGIDSPIYKDILSDLTDPIGEVEGEPWEIRVPTSLTVLQCGSGCVDGDGLPCDCDPDGGFGSGTSGTLTPSTGTVVTPVDPHDHG
jgi:hypothetical protein